MSSAAPASARARRKLAGFGMEGVGAIFAAYQRRGALEDDDEVAVIRGPAESGFPPAAGRAQSTTATERGGDRGA